MKQFEGEQSFIQKYIAGPLKRFVSKVHSIGKTRVIISGGYQDDWNTHHIDKDAYHIPAGVERINIGGNDLDLVARINEDGSVEQIPPKENPKTLEIGINEYEFIFRITHPTTVLTEDRRIFYYRGQQIVNWRAGVVEDRLQSLMETFAAEYYDEKGFSEEYRQLME